MTSQFKIAIIIASVFIFSSLGIILWTANSPKVDDKAFLLFQKSEYQMALGFTEELEKNSSSAKYPLYQAYILRERQQFERSNVALKKCLKPAKTGKNAELLTEIYLNLILNAHLKGDESAFQESLKALKQIKQSDQKIQVKGQYIDLFRGIEAYSNEDYQKALPLFQKHETFHSLSPWMKCCFEKHFTPFWINKHIVNCLISTGKFTLARQKLDEMGALKEETEEISLLKALSYFKEASLKSFENKQILHKLAILEISKIENKEIVAKELNEISLQLQKDLLRFAKIKSWNELTVYLESINHLSSTKTEYLISGLMAEIESELTKNNQSDAFTLLQKIQGPSRVKLLYNIHLTMEEALNNGDVNRLQAYADLMKPLAPEKEFNNERLIAQVEDSIFVCLNCRDNKTDNIKKAISLLHFLKSMENNPQFKLLIAKKLITQAELIWVLDSNYTQALELFQIAMQTANVENQPIIQQLMEEKISSIHKKALNNDAIEQYFYLLRAVKILKLKTINMYDEQEKNRLLEDAEVFYLKGHYNQSYKKAAFVLELEPDNESANRIVGMIAFETGHSSEALRHLKRVKKPDSFVLKALNILQPKLN